MAHVTQYHVCHVMLHDTRPMWTQREVEHMPAVVYMHMLEATVPGKKMTKL